MGINFRGLSETRSFKDTFEVVASDPINTMSVYILHLIVNTNFLESIYQRNWHLAHIDETNLLYVLGFFSITKEFLLLIILFPTKFMFSINIWKYNIGLNRAQCRHSSSINQKSYKETCNTLY